MDRYNLFLRVRRHERRGNPEDEMRSVGVRSNRRGAQPGDAHEADGGRDFLRQFFHFCTRNT